MKRVNIYFDEKLLSEFDEYCKEQTVNRSTMIRMLMKKFVDEQKALQVIRELAPDQKIADNLEMIQKMIYGGENNI